MKKIHINIAAEKVNISELKVKKKTVPSHLHIITHPLITMRLFAIRSNNSSKLSSVFNLTNNTLTPMGKRQFSNILLNPITNIEELNSIYQLTNYLKDDEVTFNLIRENLKNVKRLQDIGSYRGVRHRKSLPARGQRTKTNSRTRRSKKRQTISLGKKAV